ncbi:hypothetical protein [Ammoniphilus sp. CFH 90114]|uniref:hypothetical protein n=1 Tax=Ammoniphilus sp. CFH 90114 TaxID=2493665 RepID=UPI00100FE95A|nr:hypothetical protein [Ammoniphilus sp. CFH 90114]RXT04914.1 hypothetical protein EIZ39_19525 [Ammoniphilus sp. CFH 90114]
MMNNRQQASVQFVPPSAITPYIGQWITTSIPTIGQVTAYVSNYNRRTGMVDLWVYRPGTTQPQYMQYHYSDLIGIGPYQGPIPPYQPTPPPPYPPTPYPPSPYPPTPYPPYYPPAPEPRRSCANYPNISQQISCYLGMLPPV